jgi:hypothetical protein
VIKPVIGREHRRPGDQAVSIDGLAIKPVIGR